MTAPGTSDVLRQRVVSVRLTEAEHATWVAAAAGRQLGRWVRGELFARLAGIPAAPAGGSADRALIAEVRRIGVNVNQIARRLNDGQRADAAMLVVLKGAETALWAVHAAVIAGEGPG